MMDQAQATYNTLLTYGKEHYLPIAKDLMSQAKSTSYTILTNGKELGLPVAKDLLHKARAKDLKVLGAVAGCIVGSFFLGWSAFESNDDNWSEDQESIIIRDAFAKHVCTWKKTAVILLAAGGFTFALHKKHPLGIAISVYSIAALTLSLVPYFVGFCVHAHVWSETEIEIDPPKINYADANDAEKIDTFLQALMDDANSEDRKGICIVTSKDAAPEYEAAKYHRLVVSSEIMNQLHLSTKNDDIIAVRHDQLALVQVLNLLGTLATLAYKELNLSEYRKKISKSESIEEDKRTFALIKEMMNSKFKSKFIFYQTGTTLPVDQEEFMESSYSMELTKETFEKIQRLTGAISIDGFLIYPRNAQDTNIEKIFALLISKMGENKPNFDIMGVVGFIDPKFMSVDTLKTLLSTSEERVIDEDEEEEIKEDKPITLAERISKPEMTEHNVRTLTGLIKQIKDNPNQPVYIVKNSQDNFPKGIIIKVPNKQFEEYCSAKGIGTYTKHVLSADRDEILALLESWKS